MDVASSGSIPRTNVSPRMDRRFEPKLKSIPESPKKPGRLYSEKLGGVISIQKLSITFLVFALVLGLSSLVITLNGSILSSSSSSSSAAAAAGFGPSSSLSSFAPHEPERCIVVVVMSHLDETEQRDFHRNAFDEYRSTLPDSTKSFIRLIFAVPGAASTKDSMMYKKLQSDIIPLRAATATGASREFTAVQNYEMLELIEPELGRCKYNYLFRSETGYIINYAALATTFKHAWMPVNSTYIGSLVTNYPNPYDSLLVSQTKSGSSSNAKKRDKDETKQKKKNVFPLFAYGGAYGFSHDMVKQVLSSKKAAQGSNLILAQDRTIGLGIERAHIQIQNPVYVKDIHHLCSTDDILNSCDHYSKFIAFGLPNTDGLVALKQLESVRADLRLCTLLQRNVDGTEVNNRFFRIHQHGCESDMVALLTTQCAALSSQGQFLTNKLDYEKRAKTTTTTTTTKEGNKLIKQAQLNQLLPSFNDKVHELVSNF